ncbi:MAG: PilZ domain-containing protein [Nitrospinaceae bacterium]
MKATIWGDPYRVVIRGWRDKGYIITDTPEFNGGLVRVAPQTSCAIHYTFEGVYIKFKTSVLYSISNRGNLMVLDFPENFETYNLRRNLRQKSNYPVKFSIGDSMKLNRTGRVRDVSLKGVLLCHSGVLDKGSLITLSLQLQTGELTGVRAEVRNIRRNLRNPKKPYVTGLEFVGMTGEHQAILRKFVQNRVVERRVDYRR